MKKHISLALLTGFASLAACQKTDSDSIAVVNVNASGVVGITQLQARVTLAELSLSAAEYFPQTNTGVEMTFPTSFSLTMPRSRQGTLTVAITAVNASGIRVAFGQDSKPVVVGKQTSFRSCLRHLAPAPDRMRARRRIQQGPTSFRETAVRVARP